MINNEEKQKMLKEYPAELVKYGFDDYRSLFLYKDGSSVIRRYDAMQTYIDFKNSSIIDMGCGWGSFIRLGYPYMEYNGYDIIPELIDYAQKNYENKNAKFFVEDLDRLVNKNVNISEVLDNVADVMIMSAVTGNRGGPTWYPEQLQKVLKWSAEQADVILINFPSIWSTCRHDGTVYYSPSDVLTAALNVTRNVILDHYYESDFLLVMKK